MVHGSTTLSRSSKYKIYRRRAWFLILSLLVAYLIVEEHAMITIAFQFLSSQDEGTHFDENKQTKKRAQFFLNKSVLPVAVETQKEPFLVPHPRICFDSRLMEPIWEWHYFSENTVDPLAHKRLLIATYSAFGKSAKLLELTSPINKEYAKQWKHDMVVLQGTTLMLPYDKNCTPPEERSRFNKVDLLRMALSQSSIYDQLLIIDADTLIYDFSFDITQLLPRDSMLVAQRTAKADPSTTKSINNGIALWNLQHPLTREVAKDWDLACQQGIPNNHPSRGDQFYLRKVLNSDERIAAISYQDGTKDIIKHFPGPTSLSWNETDILKLESHIRNATNQICIQFGLDRKKLDYKTYTSLDKASTSKLKRGQLDLLSVPDVVNRTSLPVALNQTWNCTIRRKPHWNIYRFSKNNTSRHAPSKRLLVAQYSSYGSYSYLMELTAPINKAYAKKWNHDILILQGTALVLKSEGACEPPVQRSRYNKIPLLLHALSSRVGYDQLLILDADAVLYNMSFDITELLDDDDFLAAHRVDQLDNSRTWNVNDGVSLWNLKHEMTRKVAREWTIRTLRALKGVVTYGWKEHGDQHYLQATLKGGREVKGAINHTRALGDEFRYANGTVIKHFVRPKNDFWDDYGMSRRIEKIQETIEEICRNNPLDCEDLERLQYSSF